MNNSVKTYDFRSDTVSKPSPEMYQAMAQAELGDDVFEDDPTVNLLEEKAAELLGFEAAIFVPSGTMANSIAIALHTRPGNEMIHLENGHTYLFEGGGSSRLWGVHSKTLPAVDGCFDLASLAAAVRSEDVHFPTTALVVVENTHNLGGGLIVPPEKVSQIKQLCMESKLKLHMDGARLFNALVAQDIDFKTYSPFLDSLSICLSKALACPVGSLLLASQEEIQEARKIRKLLGGGMRQVGILAACGLVALEKNISLLSQDHKNCRELYKGLSGIPEMNMGDHEPETNILICRLSGQNPKRYREFTSLLEQRGIRCINMLDQALRFVTHCDVDAEAVESCIANCRAVLTEMTL